MTGPNRASSNKKKPTVHPVSQDGHIMQHDVMQEEELICNSLEGYTQNSMLIGIGDLTQHQPFAEFEPQNEIDHPFECSLEHLQQQYQIQSGFDGHYSTLSNDLELYRLFNEFSN